MLNDSDVDEPVATQADEEPSASTPTGGIVARESSSERRSVPYRARSRLSGGPNASLNELLVLAKRKPLKIHIVVPESFRDLKRKQDAVDEEVTDSEMERESCADGTPMPMDSDDVPQGGQAGSVRRPLRFVP